VNAVLRRAIREADFDPSTAVVDPLEKLAIETSHPRWLVERWARQFGVEEAAAFARANNRVPPTAFRVVDRDFTDLENQLVLEPSKVAENAWRVEGAASRLRELAAEGKIYLQDEASQLVAQTVEIQPGERVLDLCAAPGSKTTLMALRANDSALIVASDRSPTRLNTVVKTGELQKLTSIKSVVLDAMKSLPFDNSVFDRILIDAPCSGTGTLRRNPEIRYRISENDIHTLATQQKLFLQNATRVLKPGGQLVYSTCSVEREENEQVIDAFLAANAKFQLTKTTRTWPHREGSDGFFIASLRLATQQ
jgi:16S rRNA (cytosine967-C5)-methyltransferase